MKFITVLLFAFAFQAQANCPAMAKKVISSYAASNPVNSSSYATFSEVTKHYRNEIAEDSDFKPFIKNNSAYIKGRKLTGYEVVVTMGGDEDTVRYVLNAEKQIVVAYWYNQSPMTYWFCGKKTATEEYTEEGTEL